MRTCKYCGTLYEEMPSTCPNCGKVAEDSQWVESAAEAVGMAPMEAENAESPGKPAMTEPQANVGYTWGDAAPSLHMGQPIPQPPPSFAPPQGQQPFGVAGAYAPPPPTYMQAQWEDVQKHKQLAILAYLGVYILVPAIAAPNSPYVKFHMNQALVLLIADVILGVVYSMVCGTLLTAFGFIFGLLLSGVFAVIGGFFLVLWIMGLVGANAGKCQPLPLLGRVRIVRY